MDGILVVDKPQGITSHDVVDFVRKRFAIKKAGHAGTLDPMATGVLVTLIGTYTKRSSSFANDDKEYEATLTLGATSDTCDGLGRIKPSGKDTNFTNREIENVFKKFIGEIEQTPPMYSAVRFNGVKLYELARRGISIQGAPRKVWIKNIEISRISLPEVSFKVCCSKGTYIRSIAQDIGIALGCGAYLSYLRRIRSGRFIINEAIRLEEVNGMNFEDLERRLIHIR